MSGELTEAEREALRTSGSWPHVGTDLFVAVERIIAARRESLAERVKALADRQQRAGDRLIEKYQERRSPNAERRWTEGYALRRSAAALRALLDPSETP